MESAEEPKGCPPPGAVIDGKYRVERILGRGGMGAVVKATHLLRRAPVALKFMSPAFALVPGAIERFVNEAVAASRIHSDNVVQIYDVGRLPGDTPYLVMEYLEGLDLAQLLDRDGAPGLPIERALHFTMQILRGLEVAHGAGIVHRDMKPSNCFVVRREGHDDFVKLLDFGISKVTETGNVALTQANSALGTPLYMSPEQARSAKDVDARCDIYSAGVILYELLTGRTPFTSESGDLGELLAKIFTETPPAVNVLRPDLPTELAGAVHVALARDREMRFPTVVHFAEALAPFIGPMTESVLARIRSDLPGEMSHALSLSPVAGPTTAVAGTPRFAARPAVVASQAFAEEATAATMYANAQSLPPPGAAARTDLGAVTDTDVPKSRRAPLPLAAALAALVLGGGAAGFLHFRSGAATSEPKAPAAVAPPPPASTPAPPVEPPPLATESPIPPLAPTASAAVAPLSPLPRPSAPPHSAPTAKPASKNPLNLEAKE